MKDELTETIALIVTEVLENLEVSYNTIIIGLVLAYKMPQRKER